MHIVIIIQYLSTTIVKGYSYQIKEQRSVNFNNNILDFQMKNYLFYVIGFA